MISPRSILTAVDYSTYNNGYFNDLRVNKFTASGKADSTYGAGAGYIDVASSTDYGLRSLAFYVNRADGVVFHLATDSDGFRLRRFNQDGTISLTSPLLHMPDYPNSYFPSFPRQIGVQPDGKPLLIGTGQYSNNDLGWAAIRLNVDFTYDTTLAARGRDIRWRTTAAPRQTDGKGSISASGSPPAAEVRASTARSAAGPSRSTRRHAYLTGTRFAEDRASAPRQDGRCRVGRNQLPAGPPSLSASPSSR